MTSSVGVCKTDESLAKAVEIMFEKDCGIVPIINKKSKVIGMISDRDVAVSVFLRGKSAGEILCGEILNGKVLSCSAKDDVADVLKIMKTQQIKRLPVVDKKGKLEGIISITDILLASENDKKLRQKVMKTLEAISKPRAIVLNSVEE